MFSSTSRLAPCEPGSALVSRTDFASRKAKAQCKQIPLCILQTGFAVPPYRASRYAPKYQHTFAPFLHLFVFVFYFIIAISFQFHNLQFKHYFILHSMLHFQIQPFMLHCILHIQNKHFVCIISDIKGNILNHSDVQ